MNVVRKGKPSVLVTVPGSPGGPLAKGNDLSRAVYTRWAYLTRRGDRVEDERKEEHPDA